MKNFIFKGDGLRARFALGLLVVDSESDEIFFTVRFPFDISPQLLNEFARDLIEGLEESYWGRSSDEHDLYSEKFYRYFASRPSVEEQKEMLEIDGIDILKDYNDGMSKSLKEK